MFGAGGDCVVVLAARNVTSWSSAVVLAALLVAGAAGGQARAAALMVEAPASCVDPSELSDQVADLAGKSIADVPDVDFRIQVAGTAHQRWRLRLQTLDRAAPGAAEVVRGTRELEAASCPDLVEAAALAIAVSLRSVDEKRAPPILVRNEGTNIPAPALAMSPAPPLPARSSWRAGAGLGVVVETGVLPHAAQGIEVGGSLRHGALGLALRGTWFGAQDTVGSSASGGSFQLAAGAALACFVPERGRWVPSACAGLELGRLTGAGLNVARPHSGAVLWSAGHAEAGVARRVGGDAAVFLRAGLAVPLARPTFVLDESRLVHRPSRIAGSLAAGIELAF